MDVTEKVEAAEKQVEEAERVLTIFNNRDGSSQLTPFPRIGLATIAILKEHGYYTAWDIYRSQWSVESVPTIGPGKGALLRQWVEKNVPEPQKEALRELLIAKRHLNEAYEEQRTKNSCLIFAIFFIVLLVLLVVTKIWG